MQKFKKLLVALNLEQGDASLIRYAARVAKMASSEEVHFYHVSEDLDLPASLCSALEGDQSCQMVVGRMEDLVESHFQDAGDARVLFDASEGDRFKDVLSYIKAKDIDLVLAEKVCGGSKIPERLARKAPCSALLVPPDAPASFGKIFVALDFSEQSRQALQNALAFAQAAGTGRVTCVHVYAVPLGYAKTGHTYDQFANIMKTNAQEEYDRFMKTIDTQGLAVDFVLELNKRPVDGIAGLVHGKDADLLVVGARGRSKTMAVLLGSVTERLIEICNVPILAVKTKGQGMSVLEALFDL